mmetsp:Transcript_27182/g.54265  ORF Transcript_27182/g.54265 Transcript_27182/m.54265 type:complete len:230 (+) Transcript_27182:1481-2170(+)
MRHPDDVRSLAVADGVEDLLDLLGVLDWDLDGVAGAEGVEPQGGLAVVNSVLLPHLPGGEHGVRGHILRPGREPLVEPEVVPPLHRDKVSKPLVRKLVRDDRAHPLPLAAASLDGVYEQVYLPVRDQAPVLHGPHGELGDAYHVELGERVRHAEEVVVKVEGLEGALEAERARLGLAGGGVHADHDAVGGDGLDEVKVAHAEGHEVRRHLGRVHELHLLELPTLQLPAP